MGQVGIDQSMTGGPSVFDLTKLEPKQAGERARVWIPDPTRISMQYAHALGGKRSQQPGFPEPGWGGNWICTGDPNVLKDSTPHSDPERCVMCRLHKEGNPYVDKAKRKWIVQVFRYATDPSGASPLTPFTMTLIVWQFSDKQYRMLNEIQTQWGDIRQRDLLFTSDQGEFQFKQWAIQALPDLMIARDPSWTEYMQQAWASQAVDPAELERIIGRTASNDNEVLAKLQEITPQALGQQMGQQYAQPPGIAPLGQGFAPGPPGMAPPAPGAGLYPGAGPFDQPQQVMGMPPAAPGMLPPAMPPTPPPGPSAAPPLPQVPDLPQQVPQQPQMAAPAPQQQMAPPMPQAPVQQPQAAQAIPLPQVPDIPQQQVQQQQPMAQVIPMPQQAPAPQVPQQQPMVQQPPMPQVPQQQMAPPVSVPGAQAVPGQPAAPGAPVDLTSLMASPPPPPPPG